MGDFINGIQSGIQIGIPFRLFPIEVAVPIIGSNEDMVAILTSPLYFRVAPELTFNFQGPLLRFGGRAGLGTMFIANIDFRFERDLEGTNYYGAELALADGLRRIIPGIVIGYTYSSMGEHATTLGWRWALPWGMLR